MVLHTHKMLILLNLPKKAYLSTLPPLGHLEEYSPMILEYDEQGHLALRHPDGVVAGEGVAILCALPGGKVNKPGGRVKVTSASQNLKINVRLVIMMQ